jgi:hypothetical protein
MGSRLPHDIEVIIALLAVPAGIAILIDMTIGIIAIAIWLIIITVLYCCFRRW